MIKYENDCVDCGLPCMGSSCPYQNAPHWHCDECDREVQLYYYDDRELCIDCIEKELEKVSI